MSFAERWAHRHGGIDQVVALLAEAVADLEQRDDAQQARANEQQAQLDRIETLLHTLIPIPPQPAPAPPVSAVATVTVI